MRKILIALCALSLTGCQALSDGFHAAESAIKAPPQAVSSAFSEIVHFAIGLLIEFATTLFAPYLHLLGL
jgi:putative Mn2+ efflux pump MntP